MPLHSSLRKSSLSPKEKAVELAEQSIGQFQPLLKPEPNYAVPININKRDVMITTVKVIIESKGLPQDDKIWWKEVLAELQKLPSK